MGVRRRTRPMVCFVNVKSVDRIDQALQEDPLSRVKLRVPQQEGKALAILEGQARIFSRAYRDGSVELDAQVPQSVLRKVRSFVRE